MNIQQVEMLCVEQRLRDPDNEHDQYEISNQHESIAEFWMECDDDVGWYKGESTRYIVVEWQVNGGQNGVHGYPITADELRNRGAKL